MPLDATERSFEQEWANNSRLQITTEVRDSPPDASPSGSTRSPRKKSRRSRKSKSVSREASNERQDEQIAPLQPQQLQQEPEHPNQYRNPFIVPTVETIPKDTEHPFQHANPFVVPTTGEQQEHAEKEPDNTDPVVHKEKKAESSTNPFVVTLAATPRTNPFLPLPTPPVVASETIEVMKPEEVAPASVESKVEGVQDQPHLYHEHHDHHEHEIHLEHTIDREHRDIDTVNDISAIQTPKFELIPTDTHSITLESSSLDSQGVESDLSLRPKNISRTKKFRQMPVSVSGTQLLSESHQDVPTKQKICEPPTIPQQTHEHPDQALSSSVEKQHSSSFGERSAASPSQTEQPMDLSESGKRRSFSRSLTQGSPTQNFNHLPKFDHSELRPTRTDSLNNSPRSSISTSIGTLKAKSPRSLSLARIASTIPSKLKKSPGYTLETLGSEVPNLPTADPSLEVLSTFKGPKTLDWGMCTLPG